jgi:glycine dehydrogenase subunit 1
MLMGRQGLREVAQQNFDKAHYFADCARKAGFTVVNDGEFFNEVTIRLPGTFEGFREEMLQKGFLVSSTKIPGQDSKTIAVAVTEMITKDEIDAFVETLREVAR